MKKVVSIFIGLSVILTLGNCTDSTKLANNEVTEEKNKCISFNSGNVETLNERLDTTLYTDDEMTLLGHYLIGYLVMQPSTELAKNPFAEAIKNNLKDEGYKECSDICEVLEYQREKLKKKGISEKEFIENIKNGFDLVGKMADKLGQGL